MWQVTENSSRLLRQYHLPANIIPIIVYRLWLFGIIGFIGTPMYFGQDKTSSKEVGKIGSRKNIGIAIASVRDRIDKRSARSHRIGIRQTTHTRPPRQRAAVIDATSAPVCLICATVSPNAPSATSSHRSTPSFKPAELALKPMILPAK